MKKLNWKIILIVVFVIIIIVIIVSVYNNKRKAITITENERLSVNCVPNCAEDEVCVKGACVKKKINYTL